MNTETNEHNRNCVENNFQIISVILLYFVILFYVHFHFTIYIFNCAVDKFLDYFTVFVQGQNVCSKIA